MNIHLQRGEMLLAQSRPADAEKEAGQALASDPQDAFAHALLARSRAAQNRAPDAIEAARRAVSLAPDSPYCHRVLAFVLHGAEKQNEAFEAIGRALAMDPSDVESHVLRSSIQMARRNWSEALIDADRALALDAENVGALNLRSLALTQLGRREEALATGEFALRRDPENALAHAAKGWNSLHERRPHEAQHHFREALRLQPDLEYARQGMLEALKARNPLYRGMLAHFLWMGRQSRKIQWAFVILTVVGLRVVRSVAEDNPNLGLILWPVVVVGYLFIYLSWTAGPMFNLLLKLDRFGRLVLSRREARDATWFGLSLLPVVGAAAWWFEKRTTIPLLSVIAAVMLSVCVAATVNAEGRKRRLLGVASAALAALAVAAIFSPGLFTLFFLGFLAFQLASNALR